MKAIAEGRYKEVNIVGAATIVVARKAMGGNDFPFVFGGDGATLLVPNMFLESVCENLGALKKLSIENHGLELRVGVVPIEELQKHGKHIEVGKLEITPGRSIAILRGEGIAFTEKLIKDSDKFEFKGTVPKEANLSGLSCRWQPIPSRRGKVIAILVSSRRGKEVYGDFLRELENILPDGIENSNPTNVELASYKSLCQLIKEEIKLHYSPLSLSFLLRILEISFAVFVFRYKFPALFFDSTKYSQSMRTHSDFRKFDDVLRMVLDCSCKQIENLKEYLQLRYEKKDLFYGTFETDYSLMTCFVEGLGQGRHIHFIDAENGGYAAAAIELKKQMKSEIGKWSPTI